MCLSLATNACSEWSQLIFKALKYHKAGLAHIYIYEILITKQSQKYKLYHNLWYSCLFQNSIGNRLDVQKNTYSCIAPMHNLNVVAATPFLLRIKEATTSHDYCYYYAQCYDECEHIETLFFFNPISGARGGAVIHCSTYCIGLHNTPGAHGNECCHVFFAIIESTPTYDMLVWWCCCRRIWW